MELIKSTAKAPLLTPAEAANILGTTPGVLAVWRTTKRYPLRYVKVGRSVRYKLEDVQSFIDSRTVCLAEV